MANNDNPNGFQIAYTQHGGPPVMMDMLLDESQSIKKGDVVYQDESTRRLKIATAAIEKVAGVAAHDLDTDASETTTKLKIYSADPENIFVGQCSGAPAVTDILKDCDIEGTTGIMEVDEDANETAILKILSIHPADEIGANARVFVRFNPDSSQVVSAR